MGFRTCVFALLIAWLSVFLPGACAAAAPDAAEAAPAAQADAPYRTADGHRFVAPPRWTVRAAGSSVILQTPEGDSRVALVDLAAEDADAAVAAAWAQYDPDARWALGEASDRPARFGWAQIRSYRYAPPAAARRFVHARAQRHGERWTVVLVDLSEAAFNTRESELTRLLGSLWPKGYIHVPETFAGKTAHRLDAARLAQLTRFVEAARRALDVPGVALGIVQDGQVVFAGGFGVRERGREGKVDAETLFLSASITKPLTTLMLAKLVDGGRFSWETPVTEVLPGFRLGDAELTRQVRMKHLVCACTGMPRQDMEWVFGSEGRTPASTLASLAGMTPTAGLGEVYQYSNPIAAVAGFAGGHAMHPERELGAAYDAAMQELVFDPLGMHATTFDYVRAQRDNFAAPHGRDFGGATLRVPMDFNYSSIALRPDGGAWSSVADLLRYVQMELAVGRLPDGRRYVGEAALLERRQPQVPRGGAQQFYGMGLKIDRNKGTPALWHGGSMAGYQTEAGWFPEHGVGYVLLTNADAGMHLRGLFPRRLLEVLFDAVPEAEANLALAEQQLDTEAREQRETLSVPADATLAAQLADRYRSAELGLIDVERKGGSTWFDFGIWESEVASRREAEGATVFATVSPSVAGYEFRVAVRGRRRALVLSDGQREYLFTEERGVEPSSPQPSP